MRIPLPPSGPKPVAAALLAACFLLASAPARAGSDWNDGAIRWRSYREGLSEARLSGKPVCLVFFTEWCPHCRNYGKVFHDPEVVRAAKRFVMIRLDEDQNADLGARYVPDGQYVPRTFFLSPAGTLDASVHAPRNTYRFFYDESDPASLLGGMERALLRHGDDEQEGDGDGAPSGK